MFTPEFIFLFSIRRSDSATAFAHRDSLRFNVAIGPTSFTMAAWEEYADVTQAIHNVQLLASHAASVTS